MSNIPRGSNLLIAHVISVIFNSLVTYYLLHRTFKEVLIINDFFFSLFSLSDIVFGT
jgi:hypothetical protein